MFIVHYNSHNPYSKMHKFLGTNPRSFFPGVGSAFVCSTAVGCFNSSGTKTRRHVTTQPEQKEFSTSSSQKDLLLLRARILLSSLLHVLACLSYACHHMSAASAFVEEKVQRICAINFTTRICTKNCAWICIYECTRICAACGGGGLRPRSSKAAQAPHL